ncbi:DUF2326 domain-containing protein [[Clostridium] innocuum]|nr:DUF2326 domain-containing protein [[Clostridium] innocuum]
MLYEISCKKFKQKRVQFKEGLNTILGTNVGDNSIGKSSFLLIVDFVFGGNTYTSADDIIRKVKEHSIDFTFKFDEKLYYFSRDVSDSKKVWICNKEYTREKVISLEEYCQWLNEKYMIQLPDITFRNIVSRYIRVYGKDNANEKYPLHNFPKESAVNASYALLKLFNLYTPIHVLSQQANLSNDELKTYKKAQKYNFISNIKKRDVTKNEIEIKKLTMELSELTNSVEKGFADLDAEISEEAIKIKKLLSRSRRLRSTIKSRIEKFNDDNEYNFSSTTKDFENLAMFFPSVNIKKLEDIETFHNRISTIFKSEIKSEKRKLEKELEDYNNLIKMYEGQLEGLIKNPKLSKTVLSRYSKLLSKIDELEKENTSFKELNRLNNNKKEDETRLKDIKQKQFDILASTLNSEMKKINNIIYGKTANAPIINFLENNYSFFTPDDTGTGTAYKGIVVLDLSVLNLTQLPIVVHDSIVLKQISDEAIEKILELYIANGKQVIIALDKQNTYTEKSRKILNENAILYLAPNGNELFGRSWSRGNE